MLPVPSTIPEIKGAGVADSLPPNSARFFDLERILPIELIRQHTKTDDIPHVTDEQLALYRQSAIEACEEYTNQVFTRRTMHTEHVTKQHSSRDLIRGYMVHRLDHPATEGLIWLYGSTNFNRPMMIETNKGATKVRIPIQYASLDLSPCCGDPCNPSANGGLRIMYAAGLDCEDSVPAWVKVGCLKYIAWTVENPGDVVMTVQNNKNANSAGIIGTNNAIWASGALEEWRSHVRTAV